MDGGDEVRARVYRNFAFDTYYWVFEVFDPDARNGYQVRMSGVRMTWRQALEEALLEITR